MRIVSIHQFDAPSESNYTEAAELLGDGVSIRVYVNSKEDLKRVINALLVTVNIKEKENNENIKG